MQIMLKDMLITFISDGAPIFCHKRICATNSICFLGVVDFGRFL